MKRPEKQANKELYQQLRSLPWEQLWNREARSFDAASPEERERRVAVVRAVGVVFSESGEPQFKDAVKSWLIALLHDPSEKIRRYALAALPKIGAGPGEEAEVLRLLRTTNVEREKKFVAQALEKIGGVATLETIQKNDHAFEPETEQKVKASLARHQSPSAIRLAGVLPEFDGLTVHLRGRRGLENIVRAEAVEFIAAHGKFRLAGVGAGCVALTPIAPFALADIYSLRCFGTVGFVVGAAPVSNEAEDLDRLASVITSPLSRGVLQALTEGAIRYRLNFVSKGHQRGAVRHLASRVYSLCPEILNDARDVTWTIDIYSGARANSVELRPNLTPDPRFSYRRQDVPAASHPHLAACMARLAGKFDNEIVWDPFCGSGLELVERALLGGVRAVHGTDLSAKAVEIARDNFAAAKVKSGTADFVCCDFREYVSSGRLKPNSVTLIITNPPLGMRVPVKDLRGLIADLFDSASKVLHRGGRLVFANPLSPEKPPRAFQLLTRQAVDFDGFDCRVEKYVKL